MRSELARLGGISFDFAGIPPRWDENFPYEQAQVGQPGKVGYSFLYFFFQMLIKQEDSDDLSVCVLNILPRFSSYQVC